MVYKKITFFFLVRVVKIQLDNKFKQYNACVCMINEKWKFVWGLILWSCHHFIPWARHPSGMNEPYWFPSPLTLELSSEISEGGLLCLVILQPVASWAAVSINCISPVKNSTHAVGHETLLAVGRQEEREGAASLCKWLGRLTEAVLIKWNPSCGNPPAL